jgi:hypothetical protein
MPNPGNGIFKIKTDINVREIKIYNQNGQELLQNKPESFDKTFTLDLTSYGKGIYFVKLCAGDKIYIRKLVVI